MRLLKIAALTTVAALSLLNAACAPVDLLNKLTPDESFTLATDISYGQLPEQKLDVYSPQVPKAGAPTVLFIYGGGWNSGTKDIYKFIGEAFTSAGYTTVIPTYRTYTDVIYPEFIHDAAKATAWAHEEFDQPIVIIGHSAGAHIASMLALRPDYLDAVDLTRCETFAGWVGLAGPYDFKVYEEPYLSIFPTAVRERDSQPISYASNANMPALLLTGLDDKTVDPSQTERMEAALKAAGVNTQAKYYEDTDHIAVMARLSKVLRKKGDQYADVTEFIDNLPPGSACAP